MSKQFDVLLAKSTHALAKATYWADKNNLRMNLMATAGAIAMLGVSYSMFAAGHGMGIENDAFRQGGQMAVEQLKAAELAGLRAIVGDVGGIEAAPELIQPLLKVISAPFEGNWHVEAWRGIGIMFTSFAGFVAASMSVPGMRWVSGKLEDLKRSQIDRVERNQPELIRAGLGYKTDKVAVVPTGAMNTLYAMHRGLKLPVANPGNHSCEEEHAQLPGFSPK